MPPPTTRDEALAERLRARIALRPEAEIAHLLAVDERSLLRIAAGGRGNAYLVAALRTRLDALDALTEVPPPAASTATPRRRRRTRRTEGT
jgi:hypothetical protein